MDPVHGSDEQLWKDGYQTLYLLSAINLAIGLLSVFLPYKVLQTLGGPFLIVSGAIFLVLGLFMHKKKSHMAVILSLSYWSLEIVATIYSAIFVQKNIEFIAIVVKIWFWYMIWKSLSPTRRLSKIMQVTNNGPNH